MNNQEPNAQTLSDKFVNGIVYLACALGIAAAFSLANAISLLT